MKDATLDKLRRFDSPTVANTVEHFAVRDPVTGFAGMELKCQFSDQAPMVGYAVTCTADTTTPGRSGPMRLDRVLDMVHGAPKPAVLAIQFDGADRAKSCIAGDMFTTALAKLGVAGLVTDMGARDMRQIHERAPDFQLFCPGAVVSHGYGVFLEFDVDVSICGLTIRPGDLLHGDDSGLLTIPIEIADAVAERAGATRQSEADYFEFLENDFSYEGLKGRLGIR